MFLFPLFLMFDTSSIIFCWSTIMTKTVASSCDAFLNTSICDDDARGLPQLKAPPTNAHLNERKMSRDRRRFQAIPPAYKLSCLSSTSCFCWWTSIPSSCGSKSSSKCRQHHLHFNELFVFIYFYFFQLECQAFVCGAKSGIAPVSTYLL